MNESFTYNINYGSALSGSTLYNANFEVDWSRLEEQPYLIYPEFLTRADSISTTESTSSMLASGFPIRQFQDKPKKAGTQFLHEQGIVMFAIRPMAYNSFNQQKNIETPPLLLYGRPSNFINFKWVDDTHNNAYAPLSGNFLWNITLNFVPLNRRLREIYPKVSPFSVALNSVSAENPANSAFEFNLDWGKTGVHNWDKWRIKTSFLSVRLYQPSGESGVLKSNFFNQSNNFIANDVGSPNQSSDILALLYFNYYSAQTNLIGDSYVNTDVFISSPPVNNDFYIKVCNMSDPSVLWTGNGGSGWNCQILLTFIPVV